MREHQQPRNRDADPSAPPGSTRAAETVTTRQTLYRLVDELPEHLWPEAERYLTGLGTADPVLRALLLAPLEDEKLSPEEQAALAEARARRGSGECHYTASEELRREIGW